MKSILQPDAARYRKCLALLGLLLFGLFVAVQVIHAHPLGQDDDLRCTVCLTTHATPVIFDLPVLLVLVSVLARISQAEPQLVVILRFTRSFIRPPPATA